MSMSMSMWSLRWHFTNKSVTRARYIIRGYSLSHSWTLRWRVHTTTETCSAVLRSRRNCSNYCTPCIVATVRVSHIYSGKKRRRGTLSLMDAYRRHWGVCSQLNAAHAALSSLPPRCAHTLAVCFHLLTCLPFRNHRGHSVANGCQTAHKKSRFLTSVWKRDACVEIPLRIFCKTLTDEGLLSPRKRGMMFLPALVCLSVCLFVTAITK